MPLPLREPFFLKGRTSVVQRAVIMSAVLGGLASGAGWCAIIVAGVLVANGAREDHFARTLSITWAFAAVAMIYGPLNFWNRRSWLWSLTALLVSFAAPFNLDGIFETNGPAHLVASLGRLLFGFAVVSGLLLIRRRKLHLLAYVASVSGAAVPILILLWFNQASRGPYSMLFFWLAASGIVSSWLSAFAIPWGIPFWWPPEKDAGAES